MAPLHLITGFPGFIGARLVERLLSDDTRAKVVALVEPRMAQRAREIAADLTGARRLEVLEGDITDRRLGLTDGDYNRLAGSATTVFHLAAIYDLAVPLEIAQTVNVEGTGNIVDFCAAAKKLERHHYISTAYVAGVRHGVVYEHELVMGQEFKNHYESTKFQAEAWVRASMGDVPTTIYRPAIVVGDSHTGETAKFDGPYYMLRTVAAVGQGRPIPQIGGDAAFNVVPVDFVVDALAAGLKDDHCIGQTLHLVDPEPIKSSEVMRMLSREYAGVEPRYRMPARMLDTSLRSKRIRSTFGGTPRESIRYLNHAVRFDTRNATDLLARQGLRCPRFEEYVKPVVKFFREHEDDPSYAPATH